MANLAAAPLTFCCQNVATAGDDGKCCPGLLPGQVCPMHHTKEGERTCKMRSVCTGTDASLVALAGGLGAMPASTAAVSVFDLGDLARLRRGPRSCAPTVPNRPLLARNTSSTLNRGVRTTVSRIASPCSASSA